MENTIFSVKHSHEDTRIYKYIKPSEGNSHIIELVNPSQFQIKSDIAFRNTTFNPISIVDYLWFKARKIDLSTFV